LEADADVKADNKEEENQENKDKVKTIVQDKTVVKHAEEEDRY